MKTPLTIFTLVFTVMFSSTSFAGWTRVAENINGDTYYVEFERIKKHGGHVFYWYMVDYLKPDEDRDLSAKVYVEADCSKFRLRWLSISYHKAPMGTGTSNIAEPTKKGWKYPPPGSTQEAHLKAVCSR